MFDHSFPACSFLKVEISMCTLIPLFRQGSAHSGSASWDNCHQTFPDMVDVSLFPDRFPHYAYTVALSAHSDFTGWRMHVCLGITCHLHFWQNDRCLLPATAVTQGLEGWGWGVGWVGADTEQESARKVNSGEKSYPASYHTHLLNKENLLCACNNHLPNTENVHTY